MGEEVVVSANSAIDRATASATATGIGVRRPRSDR